ncbi:MAG: amidohydrolase family protein [Gemmatimonadetes bacterium]|nr:amidohydrolase family protein [Gemmatimonadota bacterium]
MKSRPVAFRRLPRFGLGPSVLGTARASRRGAKECCHAAAALVAVTLAAGCSDRILGPGAADFPDEPAPDPQPEVVAFVDVNVVPMDSERVLEDRTVVVRGERIETIGPVATTPVPEGAFRIEGRGRYLVPGLADMHAHTTSGTFPHLRNDFVSWLAHGVTTLRVMWGSPGVLAERGLIEDGQVLGPTLLVASAGIDGPGGPWEAFTPSVSSAEEARQRTAEHVAAGYDFIKVYNELDSPSFEAIVEEAAASGTPVVGHVPFRVGIESVQDAGQSTSEHFIGIKRDAASVFNGGALDMARVHEIVERSAAAGLTHTPTITVDALSRSQATAIQTGAEIRFISPGMRDFFVTGYHHGLEDGVAEREHRNHRLMIAAIRDAGGRLLVGTDAGFGWILPGSSMHDELASFEQAGLSPYEVLRAATADAAAVAGREDDFGRVAEGMRADLILVARNPLAEVGALRESSGTMVRGRWLSRETLAAMRDAIAAEYVGGASLATSAPGLASPAATASATATAPTARPAPSHPLVPPPRP